MERKLFSSKETNYLWSKLNPAIGNLVGENDSKENTSILRFLEDDKSYNSAKKLTDHLEKIITSLKKMKGHPVLWMYGQRS